jgi:hypothetical protein
MSEVAEEGLPNQLPASLSPGALLTRHAVIHLLVWVVAFCLFAAADSWSSLTGLAIASLLAVVTGALAGLATVTLIHEWFHFAGAWLSGGAYTIPAKPGLFVYDWDFTANSVRQFKLMSVAGSVGGAVGLVLLWSSVPADTSGRAALLAGGVTSFAFAAAIEWPVLRRTGVSGDPLAELSKIDVSVLLRSLSVGIVAGVIAWYLLAP